MTTTIPRPAITVDGLTVARGGKPVLENLSLTVGAGSITGLLGPSGAGKTTLIRCIVGVQNIVAGTVTILGLPAGHVDLRSRLGYVTQSPSVYLDLSVEENVRYFGALYGLGHAAADQAIADVGLADAAKQLAGNVSGGQLSRVSLACALVGHPDLLVLDEPTVGQDPVLREELWDRFRELAGSGVTVVVSSHVMNEATRCDRLLLIRAGEVIADGAPDHVMQEAGAADMDQAFLNLVRQHSKSPVAANATHHRHEKN
jgi:ABC-2 type transport system ATP-binding protein